MELAEETSVWFTAVLRGDVNFIRVGRGTNIQDGTIVHVSSFPAPADCRRVVALIVSPNRSAAKVLAPMYEYPRSSSPCLPFTTSPTAFAFASASIVMRPSIVQ